MYCWQVLEEQTTKGVRQSPYIGVGLDESTDRATEKHAVFIVRYQSADVIKNAYLKIEALSDGRASTIYDVLCKVFRGYNIPTSKVFSKFI